jgi:hypothetical protein
MSRLFSHLENIGHDRTDVERPAAEREASTAGAPPSPLETAPPPLPASPPPPPPPLTQNAAKPDYRPASSMQSQIPGYAIASQLSLSSRPQIPAAPSRPNWPVRLWFLSLLALIGLSLAMLLSPRDDTSAAQRSLRTRSGMALEPSSDAETSPPPQFPAAPTVPASPVKAEAKVAARTDTAPPPAAKPLARREPSPPVADKPASAPPAPAGNASCSAAMAAMNLCSASHP